MEDLVIPILDGSEDIWDIDTEEEDLEYFQTSGIDTYDTYYEEYLNWWKMVSTSSNFHGLLA